MVDRARVSELANRMSKRLNSGTPFQEALSSVFQGLRGDERAEYISAVASELSMRGHLEKARALPEAIPKETTASPAAKYRDAQTGFGFGEGSPTKIRPPTRRHL